MQLESLYQEVILDHYRNPRGKGLRGEWQGESHQVNPTCGDEITLRVNLNRAKDQILDISYESQGCSISQASASVMYEQVNGKSLADFEKIFDEFYAMMQSQGKFSADEDLIGDGVGFVGVAEYPGRVKCALLAWMAAKDAIGKATQ
ncbi:MAG: Fe-S cluster assembly sulfur transfer protein SufU [Candidatus Nanopelagicales bacterium]